MDFVNKLFIRCITSAQSEKGQGSLEYIAIVVGLVALAYIGFKLAGSSIQTQASKFINCVTGSGC